MILVSRFPGAVLRRPASVFLLVSGAPATRKFESAEPVVHGGMLGVAGVLLSHKWSGWWESDPLLSVPGRGRGRGPLRYTLEVCERKNCGPDAAQDRIASRNAALGSRTQLGANLKGCTCRNRTGDLRVMSATSFHCSNVLKILLNPLDAAHENFHARERNDDGDHDNQNCEHFLSSGRHRPPGLHSTVEGGPALLIVFVVEIWCFYWLGLRHGLLDQLAVIIHGECPLRPTMPGTASKSGS